MSDPAEPTPLTLEQVWAHANEGWQLANRRTEQWQASAREVTRLTADLAAVRAELEAAKQLLSDIGWELRSHDCRGSATIRAKVAAFMSRPMERRR